MDDITAYNGALAPQYRAICDRLRALLDQYMAGGTCRLYHGAPVWFLEDNPIAGYSVKKSGVALLFWSGQSFAEKGLAAVGKFKAAEAVYNSPADIDEKKLKAWFEEARTVIWDYQNLIKNGGELKRL